MDRPQKQVTAGLDGPFADALLRVGRYLRRAPVSDPDPWIAGT